MMECQNCGEPLEGRNKGSKFCSNRCKQASKTRKEKGEGLKILNEMMLFMYQNFPERVREMMDCSHGGGDLTAPNPFHFEDVLPHTLIVAKILATRTKDPTTILAGILHDVGKPSCRVVQEGTGYVFFTGHEEEGAKIARPIIKKFAKNFKIDEKVVLNLIKDHGDLYRLPRDELVQKYKGRLDYFKALVTFINADCDGAYSSMGGVDFSVVNYVSKRI